ncbi:MAG: glycosyltransferase [Candidatus Dadabacteria bacterium]|nr:MAG: glycosyltransferase [Candidatus Dadabacteria bacterium]
MIVHLFNSGIISGPETLVLPALSRSRKDVSVVFLEESRCKDKGREATEYARSLGLKTKSIRVRSRIDLEAIKELANVLAKINPKIVHAHDVKASTYLLVARKLFSKDAPYRLCSTHHGVRGRTGFKIKLYEKFYVNCVLPFYDLVLTVCSSDREILTRRGLNPARTAVHLNGIDRKAIDSKEKEHERKKIHVRWGLKDIGVSEDSVVIGFAGRLSPEKRPDRVIDLVSELRELKGLPKWDVLIFGSGQLEESLKERVRELNLTACVHFMGYRQGLGDEMAGFDVLLSLSQAEGLPINLLEAGWAGVPVFVTPVDGVDELVPDNCYGVRVAVDAPPETMARELAALLASPERRFRLGQALKERVSQRFSGLAWQTELYKKYAMILDR